MIVSTTNDLPGYRIDEVLGEVTGAQALGADAVLAMRFDSDEIAQGYQELVAYGTAVKVTKL